MKHADMEESLNVYDEPLVACGEDPVTGFFRDCFCNTGPQDFGSHTVCVEVTEQFLQYTRFKGNDLSTPMPQHGFPGLQPGDRWCLCAARWLEAHEEQMAPRVFMQRTHKRALEIIPLALLREFAVDLN
jgi:uncharacterized protein (DUF2237 family)